VNAPYSFPDEWALGADAIYECLAAAIVAASPRPLGGLAVLDLGAGTGATSRAISRAGGRVIAVDISHAMLRLRSPLRPPAIMADIAALPLRDGCVDAAVGAFSLSHVENPTAVLCEAARAVAAGGPVLVGVFAEVGDRHEVKAIVDRIAREFGHVDPDWYVHLKTDLEPQVASEEALREAARVAGLTDVVVTDVTVDTGCDDPAALVRWRLGGAALAPFAAALSHSDRSRMIDLAIGELGHEAQSLRPLVRIMSSLAPAARSTPEAAAT
jgi:ubiquinone/menaquinone biosynthesis C-methylase UbiE